MSEYRFLARNPVVKKDPSTNKVAICLEVHALHKIAQPPSDLAPAMNIFLLDQDSALSLASQVRAALNQEQGS
ncbi:hypothetical protein [Escherichia coli]|uniref:hypothetical protein n=1 Tax=Escherichia coli TaxID=562 RepID=UPI000CFCE5C9|nr:hypothetical protein [Escherichia coli]